MMKKLKQFGTLFLTLVLSLTLAVPAFAAVEDTGFSDVDANAWYAEAASYCQEQGWMSGTSATEFSPTGEMTRAMLAAVLYRRAGSPAVSGEDGFSDTESGRWYSAAVLWASQQGLITGYGNAVFGTNDPVSREQLVTILWRQEGSPASQTAADFADSDMIADWALQAVAWAKENNVISGRSGNRFAPKASANRAEVATVLTSAARTIWAEADPEPAPEPEPDPAPTPDRRPSSGGSGSSGGSSGGSSSGGSSGSTTPAPTPDPEPTPDPAPSGTKRVLVAYFSGTGTTRGVAQNLVAALGNNVAVLHEITPQQPYTAADLDYTNSNCRSVTEQHDPSARPAIANSVENMADYDIIFLGYPIWNNDAPRIIYTFLESEELNGKTVVPFCTSGGSGIANSVSNIQGLASDATWLSGRRCSSSDTISTLASWANSLGLDFTPKSEVSAEPAPEPTPTPDPAPAEPDSKPSEETKVLIAYFSATNNTESVANHIKAFLGDNADLYEITPETPYTSADLNYNTDCRANREQNDASARPAISGSVENMEQYDVIFLGYPIWWGQAPKIMYTFLESYDLSGKTIVPFCTSGSSGLGSSATNLHSLASDATWLTGQRFSGSASEDTVRTWVTSLNLDLGQALAPAA